MLTNISFIDEATKNFRKFYCLMCGKASPPPPLQKRGEWLQYLCRSKWKGYTMVLLSKLCLIVHLHWRKFRISLSKADICLDVSQSRDICILDWIMLIENVYSCLQLFYCFIISLWDCFMTTTFCIGFKLYKTNICVICYSAIAFLSITMLNKTFIYL